jgi:multiple sugar transport system permease protein
MATSVGLPATQSEAPARLRGLKRAHVQEALAGYLFVLPSLLILAVFLILPILASFVLVFMDYDLLSPPKFAGLTNVTALFSDRRLRIAYTNTLIFTIAATFFNNVLGLMLAMAINRRMHAVLRYTFRTALFFPVLTTTASLAVVWRFILTQDRGILNYYLQRLGLEAIPWISSGQWALASVVMFDVWRAVGFLMVLYLAGLQGIPEVIYEAAMMDGAGRWQLIRHITLPLLTPTAFFCIVISLIGASQVFDNAWVLTQGGPGDASRLIALYIYEIGFKRFNMGYASVVSITLLLILLALTAVQFRGSRKWVHYD